MKRYAVLFLIAAPFWTFAQKNIPELWGTRVHDQAKVLDPAFVQRLDHQLKLYEDSTSNQIVVLVVKSLEGIPIEDFSHQVAERSKIGQANKDNGVLLLLSMGDRRVRIEVGEGLEGALPDVVCSQIIRNEFAPRFRQRQYEAGIQASVMAITQAIGGEYVADAPKVRDDRKGGSLWGTIIVLII